MEPTQLDLALREAIYFEALKESEAAAALSITDTVIAAILTLLLRKGFTSFADVPKRQVNGLITEARQTITLTLDNGNAALVERMQRALMATVNVNRRLIEKTSGKLVKVKDYAGTKAGTSRLWKKIAGDIVPGTGMSPTELLKDFNRASIAMLITGIKRAYADKWTAKELVDYYKGTPRLKHKDGALNKMGNHIKTLTRTMLAHAKAYVVHELSKLFYDRYQWFSTIDSATTNVCRSRHKKIYEYGRGPRPPAHMNCRSIIVGIMGDLSNMAPASYWDWIRNQPLSFLKDVLTPAQVQAIASGAARARDYPQHRAVRGLTPSAYEGKFNRITSTE